MGDVVGAGTVVHAVRRRGPVSHLIRDPQAVVAGTVLLVIVVLGLLANVLASHGPNQVNLNLYNSPVGTPGYPLGADSSGRDIFARLLHSTNTAVVAGLIGGSVSLVIGVVFGLIGGYFAGRIRFFAEWAFSLVMTFPALLLLLILQPLTKGDYRITMVLFGVLMSPGVYRIVVNVVATVRAELYIDAARVAGLSDRRILSRHVLAVVRGPIIVQAAFIVGSAIAIQSGLAFIGVGSATIPSLGLMIADGFKNLYSQPLQFVWPSLWLGAITASLVLIGNSLRDAFEGKEPKPARVRRTAPGAQARPERSSDVADSVPLVRVSGLTVAYPGPAGALREVVRNVSFEVREGEMVGVVGESGSGKTQTAFATLQVLPPEAVVVSGRVELMGRDVVALPERELRRIRGRFIGYIPQEPMSNLDPVFTIGAQLVERLRASTGMPAARARQEVLSMLERVGIPDPLRTFRSYPHQVSGGMAQRALIAGAVASRPKVLIADEPTTALDVTVQAEILDLLRDLQAEMGMAIVLVTHNFGVVADICKRIIVMRDGEVVETGQVEEVFENPQHEYTRMLLDAILDDATVRADRPTVGFLTAGGDRS